MPKRLKKRAPSDPNVQAFAAVTKVLEMGAEAPTFKDQLSSYMASLGRRGGAVSGARRKENLSPEQRREIASKAARALWAKRKAEKKP